MLTKLFRYTLLIVAFLLVWQSCNEDDPTIENSRLRIKLTDGSSVALPKIYLDIKDISVFLADTATQEGEWMTLDFRGNIYELSALLNGKKTLLVEQYVPAGTELQQIKLMFGNNSSLTQITDTAREEIPLQIPPGLQDGIVIDAVNMEIRFNTISNLLVDINSILSIQESNGTHFLTPMMRAFPETYGGKLRGAVAPLEANPFVVIVQDKDTLYTLPMPETRNERQATFQFIGLKPGEWRIHLLADPETNYQDTVFYFKVEQGKTNDIPNKPITLKSTSTPDPEPEPEPEG